MDIVIFSWTFFPWCVSICGQVSYPSSVYPHGYVCYHRLSWSIYRDQPHSDIIKSTMRENLRQCSAWLKNVALASYPGDHKYACLCCIYIWTDSVHSRPHDDQHSGTTA
ncbi:hypothetical protein OG21DRAFT_1303760 [Imleria badia]|nr:hypothetical protein OG21DRAFT_1303760 [Imleria badia]